MGRRRMKVHCSVYFNPSVMIAFLNLHTEPRHLLLKTASSVHSTEIVDFKGSFSQFSFFLLLTPTCLLLLFFPHIVYSLLTGRVCEAWPQPKSHEGETKAEVQSPGESYLSAKAKVSDGRVHSQALGDTRTPIETDPLTHQETERHKDFSHTTTQTEILRYTQTHRHRHRPTHRRIHGNNRQTETQLHKDTHTHPDRKK